MFIGFGCTKMIDMEMICTCVEIDTEISFRKWKS